MWVATMLLVAVAGSACGSDDSASDDTPDEDRAVVLYGEWLTFGGTNITYGEDGTWSAQHPSYGAEPFDWGTFTFDGDVLEFSTDAGSSSCSEGQTGVYEATFTDEGELDLEKVEDPCPGRSSDFFGGMVRASD
jgi:hypothetical protein